MPNADETPARRTLSILGDSVSTFAGCIPGDFAVYYDDERQRITGVMSPSDTWWGIVADVLGWEVLANASYSGSLVEGGDFPAGCSTRRIEALGADGRTPDMVIVYMGINDYGWGGAATRALSLRDGAAHDAAPGALSAFEDAYGMLLCRVRETYPAADVWCCTLAPARLGGAAESTFAPRLRGIELDAYSDAIRRASLRAGCCVADLRAIGRDYDAWDGLHPTALGMRQIASWVLGCIRPGEFSSAMDAHPAFATRLKSKEVCGRESCVGCAWGEVAGAEWGTVCGLCR